MDKVNYTAYKRKIMLLVATAAFVLSGSGKMWAQVTLTGSSYTQSFDAIGSGLPTGWAVYTGASGTALGTAQAFTTATTNWALTTGQFANMAASEAPATAADNTATQAGRTDRALGLRQTSGFGDGTAAFALELANTTGFTTFSLTFKLQSMDPTAGRTETWLVDYGFGSSPGTFTTIATTPSSLSTAAGTWASTSVTVNFGTALDNQSGAVWIRIRAAAATTGSNNRPVSGIDDFVLSFNSGGCTAIQPTTQSGALAFSGTTCTASTLTWTSGNGSNHLVVASLAPVAGSPADLTAYTANSGFGSGSTIAAGEYVVYNGTGNTVTVSGLAASTADYFEIFEFNGSSPCQDYLTSGTPASGNVTTIACSATYCPHLTGAMINSCNGTCAEGDNEILFFNSGSYSIPVSATNIVVKYGTTNPATPDFTSSVTSNTTFVNSLNATAGCGTLFYDAVTAGSIPANTNFIIMRSTACFGYDFSSFCSSGPVYVLFSSSATWTTGGNFANSGAAGSLRYFRTDFSAAVPGCITDYNYEPNLLTTGNDGDEITFPNNGGAANNYFNSGSCNPTAVVLPIELLTFKADAGENNVLLSWSTATETNNDFFTLERSTDATIYTPIATIKGAGNSTSEINYEYRDDAPQKGINYYRLQQTDYNGKNSSSQIVFATIAGSFMENVYPNPASDLLNIHLSGTANARADFEVSDLRGIVLLKSAAQIATDGIFTIELKTLPAGTYILKSRINGQDKETLFIKQ